MLISPELRARLGDLHLQPRSAAGGLGIGMHSSRSRGAGLEFAQYRAYEHGDEPRRIDWKLYARSDRFFVRESDRDSTLCVWIVIDASASMSQADAARRDFDKLAAARLLAACVIELALRQGDRFGLLSLSDAQTALVSSGFGARQRDRCLLELDGLRSAGTLPSADKLMPVWERVQAGDMVVMLSDFFDDTLTELAVRLASAQRDVVTIQMLSAEERDFPFKGGHLFRDVESGLERRLDGSAVRAQFLADFADACAVLGKRLSAAGIRHTAYHIDEPIDAPLRQFFGAKRTRGT